MSFRLFVDSATGVTLEPEWDLGRPDQKIENEFRTRSGARFVYRWAGFDRFKFSLNFVDSATQAVVNSWWDTNTDLLFMEEGGTEVSSVQITNAKKPMDGFNKPYQNLYRGKIELETY